MKIQKEFMDKLESKMLEVMPNIFNDEKSLEKMASYAAIYNNIKQAVMADAQASMLNNLKNVDMNEIKGMFSSMMGR